MPGIRLIARVLGKSPDIPLKTSRLFQLGNLSSGFEEVVGLYNARMSLNLTIGQRADLVHYLKSL